MKLSPLFESNNRRKALLAGQQAIEAAGFKTNLKHDRVLISPGEHEAMSADDAWNLIVNELKRASSFKEEEWPVGWEVGTLYREDVFLIIDDSFPHDGSKAYFSCEDFEP